MKSQLSAFPYIGGSFSGTGDLFASVIAGGTARGDDIFQIIHIAGKFIEQAMKDSVMDQVEAKTFCRDFDEQLDIAEKLYGQHIQFRFGEKEVSQLLDTEKHYPNAIKTRVLDIVLAQRRKYQYLF